jgi:hypothetical protein
MKTLTCGMIVRYYLMVFLALSAVVSYGQNKTVINIGEGSGAGSVAGQDSIKVAILQHQEADGVDYPNVPDTIIWKARIIDTEVLDEIGVTIQGDTAISLPSGSFLIYYNAYSGGAASHRLYNNSGSAIAYPTNLLYAASGFGHVDGPASVSIQYYLPVYMVGDVETAPPASLLGVARTAPGTEVYSEMTIIKLQ